VARTSSPEWLNMSSTSTITCNPHAIFHSWNVSLFRICFQEARSAFIPRAVCTTPASMQVIMQSYSSKSDIWSVGMVAYQLLTGRFPFCENIRTCTLQVPCPAACPTACPAACPALVPCPAVCPAACRVACPAALTCCPALLLLRATVL
jgi:hypothetical protein